MSEALPLGWVEAMLQDICEVNPRHSSNVDREQMVSFVPMPAVSDVLGIIEEHDVRSLEDVWKGYTHFQEGDVIFAKITPCMENGKIAVASNLHNGLACGSTEFHVLRPYEGISAKLIWYFLRQTSFRSDAERSMTGAVGQRRVPTNYLKETIYRVPPTHEQRRIVGKLDALFARTRQAREELEHIPTLIEHYKQAILAAAFRGELTADWREQMGYEFAWGEKTIGQVADVGTGATPKRGTSKYYDNGTIPWITSGAVNREIIDNAEEYITEVALKETNCKVFPAGTIVMAMYGEGKTRGKVSVLGIDAATNQALAAIQIADETYVLREYLLWFLHSIYLEIRRKAAGGVQPNINLTIVRSITVPIPSPEEQVAIVNEVSEASEWLDFVLNEATSALRLLDHLDQANLVKAFRGELVPQDPDDEPASVLLERIREARAAGSNGKKRKKRW